MAREDTTKNATHLILGNKLEGYTIPWYGEEDKTYKINGMHIWTNPRRIIYVVDEYFPVWPPEDKPSKYRRYKWFGEESIKEFIYG